MKNKRINDAHFIAQRLQQINKHYFIVFNARTRTWEVHFEGQKPNTLCVTVPYSALDERTVTLVNKTKIENQAALMREIDYANLQAEQRALRDKQRKLQESLEQAVCNNKELV